MKIAVIAPLEETVPPTKYGGTEWIVYHVAAGLAKKGHEVDLYAAGDSQATPYHLIPLVEKSLRTQPLFFEDMKLRDSAKLLATAKAVKMLSEKQYDIIHNHEGWRFLLFADLVKQLIVTTHHGPLDPPYQSLILKKYKDFSHISISNNQRKDLPELHFVETIYNGVDLNDLVYYEGSLSNHQYCALLARMSPEKGPIDAAIVAGKTKRPMKIATKVDKINEEYFEEFKTHLNEYVNFTGEISPYERTEFLRHARLLIAPIQWEEPFGLMFTEAMATGTPVVAYARGASPEIVVDGVTGFLVNQSEEFQRGDWMIKKTGTEGLAEAVEKIYAMNQDKYIKMRRACRAHIEKYFSVSTMVDKYEATFLRIIASR